MFLASPKQKIGSLPRWGEVSRGKGQFSGLKNLSSKQIHFAQCIASQTAKMLRFASKMV